MDYTWEKRFDVTDWFNLTVGSIIVICMGLVIPAGLITGELYGNIIPFPIMLLLTGIQFVWGCVLISRGCEYKKRKISLEPETFGQQVRKIKK